MQIPLAIYVMLSPDMAANKIYSTTGYSFWMTTTSAGYFLYDVIICTLRFEGGAYLMHGAFCFVLYTYTALSGFLHYYGSRPALLVLCYRSQAVLVPYSLLCVVGPQGRLPRIMPPSMSSACWTLLCHLLGLQFPCMCLLGPNFVPLC